MGGGGAPLLSEIREGIGGNPPIYKCWLFDAFRSKGPHKAGWGITLILCYIGTHEAFIAPKG